MFCAYWKRNTIIFLSPEMLFIFCFFRTHCHAFMIVVLHIVAFQKCKFFSTVRTCFVTSFERAHRITAGQPDPPPPSVSYQADGSSTVDVPGSARETAYEILFEQDGDEMSVSTMVLDAILKCPVDMRKELAENILLMGGTTMATGFKARLMSELKYLVTTPKYAKHLAIKVFKVHKPPAKENYVAWLGGSIFGGTDVIVTRSLSKEAYLKENRIPDWANLMYNCREDDNKTANL